MAKTLTYYIGIAQHALGGPADGRVDLSELVNDAGKQLIAMHGWNWLLRPPATLAAVSGQSYIDLPSDFGNGSIQGITATNALTATINLVSLDQVVYMRQDTIHSPLDWYVALEHPTQAATNTAPAQARLAVYPVPGSSNADWGRLTYKAGWVTLSNMSDVPNIPPDYETLLMQLVKAFALAFAGPKDGPSLDDRIDEISEGRLFTQLKTRSAMANPIRGRLQGGVGQMPTGQVFRPHSNIADAP